jgi:hypothetical protein
MSLVGALVGAPFGVAPVGILCGLIVGHLVGRHPVDLGFAIASTLHSSGGVLLELRRMGAHALIVGGRDRTKRQFQFTIEVPMKDETDSGTSDDDLYDAFTERLFAFERESMLSLHA